MPRRLRAVSMALAFVEAVTIIAQAFFLATLLDRVVFGQAVHGELIYLLLGLGTALVARALTVTARSIYTTHSGANLKLNLRQRLLHRALSGGPALRAQQSIGSLSTTLVEKIETLEPYFSRYQPQLVTATIVPLAIAASIIAANWLAGLLLVLSAPFIPLFMALIGMGAQQLSLQQQNALDRLSGLFYDRILGLTTLVHFGAGDAEKSKLNQFSQAFRQRTMRVLRVAFLSSAVLEFFSALAIAVMAIYIGFSLLGFITLGPSEDITLRWGLFMLLLAPEFYNPLRTLGQFWHDRANALAAGESLIQLEKTPEGRHEPLRDEAAQVGPNIDAVNVTLNRLTLTLPNGQTLLEDACLDFLPGRCHLITGPSGSGKTTLLNALAGFTPVARNTVVYNEHDICDLTRHQLSGLRAWLGQQPLLIEGSLRENLTLGAQADDAALWGALDEAGLLSWVQKQRPQLDLQLGPKGLGLSRGQLQRLAIAQVLLARCPVLFLDEPTTGLDHETERHLWATFTALASHHNMTVIAASHSGLAKPWAHQHWHINGDQRLTPCR